MRRALSALVLGACLFVDGEAQAELSCAVTFRLSSAAIVGALGWDTDYTAADGSFASVGEQVACTSLVPFLADFNDNTSTGVLGSGIITLSSDFVGPVDLATCQFLAASTPAISDFQIEIVEASSPPPAIAPLDPQPSVIVSSITCDTITAGCGNGTKEDAEQCDDGNTAAGDCCSPSCQFEGALAPCTGSSNSGPCDGSDHCSADSDACIDVFAGPRVCRAAAGDCDIAEQCSGTASACPEDNFQADTTACTSDVPCTEPIGTCQGGTCVADAVTNCGESDCTVTFRLASAVTLDALQWETGYASAEGEFVGESSDVACTGLVASSISLFADDDANAKLSSGIIKPGAGFTGPLDVARCSFHATGNPGVDDFPISAISATTPGSQIVSPSVTVASVTCSPPAVCGNDSKEGAEDCDDGNTAAGDCCSPTCSFESSQTACTGEASGGPCDASDHCSGTSATCVDGFAAATTCRAASGACDLAELCSGTASACPADKFRSASDACTGTSSGGPCDGADHCAGTSAACVDVFVSASVCREASGVCDVAELCDGAAGACPDDAFAPSSQACRSSAGDCDVAETCPGTSSVCPADAFAAKGTPCPDSDPCTIDEACDKVGRCSVSPKCVPDPTDSNCTQSCAAGGECVANDKDGSACVDSEPQTVGDKCFAGKCNAGTISCPDSGDCGDGNVCRPKKEACDDGPDNGQPNSTCTASCLLKEEQACTRSAQCGSDAPCESSYCPKAGSCISVPNESRTGCSGTTTNADSCEASGPLCQAGDADFSGSPKPSISDALAILKKAVGQDRDCPECACDLNGGGIAVPDALFALKLAVGQSVRPPAIEPGACFHCFNQVVEPHFGETDTLADGENCGGASVGACPPCTGGLVCATNVDCTSGVCGAGRRCKN